MFDPVIAAGLPGPELAAAVAGCDLAGLSAEQTLEVAAACKRLAAWSEATMLTAVAAFAADHDRVPAGCGADQRPGGIRMLRFGGDGTPTVAEFTAEELAVGLTIAPTTAGNLIGHALDLTCRFPAVHAALARGETDGFRAKIVTDTTRDLDAAGCAEVEAAIRSRLGRVTTGQLEKLVAARTIAADPDSAETGEQDARARKGVWTRDSYPGLTSLSAELDADAAARLLQRIDGVAHLLRRAGRTEPWQQLRADALGLLADPTTLTTPHHQHPADSAPTDGAEPDGAEPDAAEPDAGADSEEAAGGEPADAGKDDDTPGGGGAAAAALPRTVLYLHRNPDGTYHLDRHGPITEQTARRILATSTVLIKPVIDLPTLTSTGHSPRYVPPARLREAVQIRDRTCRFPGCPRQARTCQIDHNQPWPQGQTTLTNLCCLCTRHHRLKTHTTWDVRQPFPGILIWRSPTGSIHIVDQHGTTHHRPSRAGPEQRTRPRPPGS